MQVIYTRTIVTAAAFATNVRIPKGAVVRRVEIHLTQLPPGYPDASTAIVDLCTLLESDSTDSSTWLFGQETLIARRPLAWQGELHLNLDATVWVNIQGATVGNQIEVGVTID
jgi:hypothetical protein